MHALHSAGVHHEKLRFFSNIRDCNMDYRQKMIVSTTHKFKNEDDDDEDLEALRLAALKSRRAKPVPHANTQLPPQHNIQTGRSQFAFYTQRFGRREFYHPNRPPRQNGNVCHPSRINQNLIEIIPVDESALSATSETKPISDPLSVTDATEPSKFHRYTDDVSGSDEEDTKEQKNPEVKSEDQKSPQDDETGRDKKDQTNDGNSPRIDDETDPLDPEEDQKDPEDDDDILLMADLEEEDSLERLMDEMEREMNMQKFPTEKREVKPSKKETKDSKRPRDFSKSKNRSNEKLENLGASKNERRSVSPYPSGKYPTRHRSLSPKQRPRKKSPRRSPPRQVKKSQREPLILRSPRKSPPRYSPRSRSRSPRLSPRRSPNRSPMSRRLSPRGRSPLSRSPRPRSSRSPKILSRPHSPRFINRVRSPLRMSPGRSPLVRSPKQSPHRLSPIRRVSPRRSRSRSPRRSPRRSPKLSPRRLSPVRRISPRLSPRRSPLCSPRNSPRLSPRRRRSPKDRKRRSLTPEDSSLHRKENSPLRKNIQNSPELSKKVKPAKETLEVSSDPVLEARRRKFESTRPIDPITANKKIKLSKKEENKMEPDTQGNLPKRKTKEMIEEYEEVPGEELSLLEDCIFDELEPVLSDESSGPVMCVEVPVVKVEKERVKKKKKKDKEIYQVGKMKDAMLAGRIVKEKKCKKKKELTPEVREEPGEVVQEAVDEEADLRTELSRRRAERLNRTVPIQSARLLQSAFKGVVNEVAKAKNNAKAIQRHLGNAEEKPSQKEVRRVTVLHRTVSDISDSEDSKMPVRFRLGTNNTLQETRESKASRKSSKRQGRKGNS
ncbi:serine/arginine repetitive matrix protein 1-like isoform X2 [Diachasmimorpha longicaudata]|uniref:serine/arginine repetitive matrix protein 1-like isoform X2 n=1 Tax=Diachasmimorpha longicaudata TaxID=58733 RepID=UPI0030B90135